MDHCSPTNDEISDLLRSNPGLMFFRGKPTWANACVGDNGLHELPQYAAGYARAADVIIAQVLTSNGEAVDVLVYPACFCIRHAVELQLKHFTNQLLLLPVRKRIPTDDVKDIRLSHDLGEIWDYLVRTVALVDSRVSPALQRIDPLVKQCAEIDRNGQVFRYPYSDELDRHLVEQRLINFVGLDQGWRLLREGLEDLNRLIETISEEYSWGTFTATLSRFQLHQLSLALPPRGEWASEEFDRVKAESMQSLNLSGREFSKCLNIIQEHREFSSRLGIEIPFNDFDEDSWGWLVRGWIFQYPDRSGQAGGEAEPDSRLLQYMEPVDLQTDELFKRREKIWQESKDRISAEFLATLHALFYFAFQPNYSEAFDHAFQEELRTMRQVKRNGETEVFREFFHVFGKTNLIHNLARSLCALGKTQWVVRLSREVGLSECDAAITWHETRSATKTT